MKRFRPFQRILELAKPEVPTLIWATLALLGTSALNLTYPQLVREIVDGVLAGGGSEAVNRYAGILLVLFAAMAVLTAIRMYLFTVAGERIVARLRRRLYRNIVYQEVGFFDANKTGELINRLAADSTVVQHAATVNVSMLLRYLLMAIGCVGILAWTSWQLTVVMLAMVPLAVIGALIYGRWIRKLSRKVQDALARATEVAQETLSGIRTVRAFVREEYSAQRYDAQVDDAYELARHRARYNASFGALASFAGYGAISGVLWYGGILLAEERMTMGELTSFMLYTFTLSFSIGALGGLWQDFMRAIGSSERVFDLLEREAQVKPGAVKPRETDGTVHFDAVGFAYPTRPDVQVLHDLSMTLNCGEVIALVGPSGGGKSTIAALVSRFYDPTSGGIRLDGTDLRDLEPDWLRAQVGVVAQEPVLFGASIRENILYGQLDATDEAMVAAAKAANAHGFIMELPDGYETQVGERGVRLSGGQKQRIAIARALLEDPPILILDEATSALDAESEHLVKEALSRLMKGRTTLVIAHRLSTVRTAHRIVVVDGGRVVQAGTHDELLVSGGLYRQLVERQLAA